MLMLNPIEGSAAKSNPLDIERKRRVEPPAFVRSPSFETPYQLARRWAVGINEGQRGQALWVHGRPGSGKTTLLKQLHEWVALSLRIESTDVMKFFHEWRRSLEAKDHLSFVRKYRKEVDMLILENVDELQGKLRTQQEVLFTINAILDGGGSIAVSSAKHPLELKELLEPALYSRLFSGLLLDMPKPDRQFKERLWRQLMEDYGLAEYSLDVMMQERLLNIPVDSARKAKTLFINAIGRLSLKKALTLADVGELEAMHASHPVLPTQAHGRNPSEVIDKVARLCGVGRAAILGKVKRQDISLARRFVCLALSRYLGLTNCMIAHLLEKDPSTVSHALKTIEADLQTNRNIAEQWNWICTQLGMPIDTQLPS
jgi:chromosomal replication initiator protein